MTVFCVTFDKSDREATATITIVTVLAFFCTWWGLYVWKYIFSRVIAGSPPSRQFRIPHSSVSSLLTSVRHPSIRPSTVLEKPAATFWRELDTKRSALGGVRDCVQKNDHKLSNNNIINCDEKRKADYFVNGWCNIPPRLPVTSKKRRLAFHALKSTSKK